MYKIISRFLYVCDIDYQISFLFYMKHIKKIICNETVIKINISYTYYVMSYTCYSYSNIKAEDLYFDSLINVLKRESR